MFPPSAWVLPVLVIRPPCFKLRDGTLDDDAPEAWSISRGDLLYLQVVPVVVWGRADGACGELTQSLSAAMRQLGQGW